MLLFLSFIYLLQPCNGCYDHGTDRQQLSCAYMYNCVAAMYQNGNVTGLKAMACVYTLQCSLIWVEFNKCTSDHSAVKA